jgi:hypothetical protein
MPVAFDTHALIQRLIQGQMPLEQAEAVSAALQEALESSIGHLAMKHDIADVRTDLKHVKWMIATNWALTLLVLGKLLIFK